MNLLSNIILASVAAGGSYLLAGVLMYTGTRKFAELIDVPSRLRSPLLVTALAVVMVILVTQLPHIHGALDESALDSLNGVSMWIGIFMLFSALLVLKIKQHIGQLYTKAMAWLLLAMFISASEVYVTIVYYLLGIDSQPVLGNILIYGLIDPLITIAGLLYVTAAISFMQTKEKV